MYTTLQKKQGFTLIELIIVISIIAVLAAIAFMSLSGETAQARDSKRVSDLKTFEDAIATSNGKNKAIPFTTLAQASITTNTGDLYPLRSASLIEVTNSLFDSDVLPTVPRDPKGAKYLGAFMSNTDYQLYGSKENPDTKTPTAVVRGSFKEGAITDILTQDTNDTAGDNVAISVANPSRFVAGDVIKIDSEYMVVSGYSTASGVIYVSRNTAYPDNGGIVGGPADVKVHNKGAAIKLYDSAPGAESLLCNGTVADSTGATNATGGAVSGGVLTPTVGATVGKVCAVANLITDSGAKLPYSVTAD